MALVFLFVRGFLVEDEEEEFEHKNLKANWDDEEEEEEPEEVLIKIQESDTIALVLERAFARFSDTSSVYRFC